MTTYWFRPKRYGYGAAPVTWQGWLATLLMAIILAGSVLAMNHLIDRSSLVGWLIWAGIIAVIVLGFVELTRRKTDGEWRWRWGDR
jgi:hypothetical protein